MAYNSDGYIMLDFTEVDFRRTNQTIEGLYKRCVDVIGTNKFILVINANGRTPLPATCSFTNNQYVIDTCIYMFAISSNDNLFIRRNDVPASDIIDDSSISVDKTWSSLNTVEKLAPIDTVIGNPATFNTSLELPLIACKVSFSATQAGSGTPSPQNIRSINGASAIHIGNISDDTNISYFQGLLNGTYGFVDLGSLAFGYNTTYSAFYASVPNIYRPSDVEGRIIGFINSRYPASTNGAISAMDDKSCLRYNGNFWIKDTSFTDVTALKTSLNGVHLIYELRTPTTPSFTSAEFETLCEEFGMNGQSFTIQIGSTVYGGEYDAKTGVLTATDKIIDLGNLSWSASGSNFVSPYFNLIDTNIKPPATNNDTLNGMCEVLNLTSYNSVSDKCIALSSGKNLFARNSDYIDANDFKNSVTGYYLKYPLATPTTIQLSPTQLSSIIGNNTFFTDGDTLTVSYRHLPIDLI